ncbi:MAG: GAF domain-containing protein [Candidatus Dormibacteria bacterium]
MLEARVLAPPPTTVSLGVVEAGARLIRQTFAGALDQAAAGHLHVVSVDAPLAVAECVRTGPLVEVDDWWGDPRFQLGDGVQHLRASLTLPLETEGLVLGAITFAWSEPGTCTEDDVARARRVSALAGRVMTRLRSSELEHHLAMEFQERLLPIGTRSRVGAVAGSYRSARTGLQVGGTGTQPPPSMGIGWRSRWGTWSGTGWTPWRR